MNRRRGRRVTFRIRKALFELFRELANSIDSSLASLCQVLIFVGSIFEYVGFEDVEHLRRFASAASGIKRADEVREGNAMKSTLVSLSRTNSLLVAGPGRNRPHIEGSELMKVRLPSTFLHRIDLYAKLTHSSRSSILTRFFQNGLLLYMRSQRALMRTVAESMKTKVQDASQQPAT